MVSKEDNESVVNDLETKIIHQIEYYFGDINLNRDKFMKEMLTKDNGWVPIETLLTFNRLKSLSEDKNIIVNALRKSTTNLLEISESEDKIRRREEKPLPEFTDEYMNALNERTVHVKGFPLDTKLDDVMNFCKQFGSIENIEMRKNFKTKDFKGCIFVLFSTKEEAQKLIDSEEVKYMDKDLLRENKVNYLLRKKDYLNSRRNKKTSNNSSALKCDSEIKDSGLNEDKNSNAAKANNPVRFEGAVIKLKGIAKDTNYLDIKKTFAQHAEVAYVESVNNDLESFIRFTEKDSAKSALEKARIVSDIKDENEVIKVEINGKEVIAEVLTGDEEKEFWSNYERNRNSGINRKNQKKGRGYQGRKGKNMWQKGHKRPFKGSDDSESKVSKHVKTESD